MSSITCDCNFKKYTININYCDFFQQNCVSMGGHLASVHNMQVYAFIQALVLNATKSNNPTWIGASDTVKVCNTRTTFQHI